MSEHKFPKLAPNDPLAPYVKQGEPFETTPKVFQDIYEKLPLEIRVAMLIEGPVSNLQTEWHPGALRLYSWLVHRHWQQRGSDVRRAKAILALLDQETKTCFVIKDGQDQHYRGWDQGGPMWSLLWHEALKFYDRASAEAFAAEDEDAWFIREVVARDGNPIVA